MEFTDEKKKELEKQIVEIAISALEGGAITENVLGDISQFVLSRIDTIKNENELAYFLEDLSERWKIFSPLYKEQKGLEQEEKDEPAVDKAEALVKSGNIDGAIQIMKGGVS
jgi:hypothetical protein